MTFPANTGKAWMRLEELLSRVSDVLREKGIRTVVAYPEIPAPPEVFVGSSVEWVELDGQVRTLRSIVRTARYVRKENIKAMLLIDQDIFGVGLAVMRLMGVRATLVHAISSGLRTRPRGFRRLVKRFLGRTPVSASVVIAVSDFVRANMIEVTELPEDRVVRMWNGVAIPDTDAGAARRTRKRFDIAPERPVIAAICRAAPEKGVPHLLRAFDRLHASWPLDSPRPVLVYVGDGPELADLRRLKGSFACSADIIMPGYIADAIGALDGADVHVAPSVWEDAFPYAVMEPMARGCAVVATRVGGIPEQIEDGVSGVLVPPRDEAALASALRTLLLDDALRLKIGQAARDRVGRLFSLDEQVRDLSALLVDRIAGRAGLFR